MSMGNLKKLIKVFVLLMIVATLVICSLCYYKQNKAVTGPLTNLEPVQRLSTTTQLSKFLNCSSDCFHNDLTTNKNGAKYTLQNVDRQPFNTVRLMQSLNNPNFHCKQVELWLSDDGQKFLPGGIFTMDNDSHINEIDIRLSKSTFVQIRCADDVPDSYWQLCKFDLLRK